MLLPAGFENYYGILGVPAHADFVKLTTAWIVAAVVFHPECVRDRANHHELLPRCGARYRLLALAYNVLMDPGLRAAFNSVYSTEPFLALEATVAIEQGSNAMTDLDKEPRFAPHFPSMWQHRQTVTRLAAQRLAAWFCGYLESSGEVLVPRLRKEDAWIVERLAGATDLVSGVAAKVLCTLVRLRDAEMESETRKPKDPADTPNGIIRAKLKTNGLPRHWAIPVRAGLITPAMKRVDKETPVLSVLFPTASEDLAVLPLDLEDGVKLETEVPAYLKAIKPKTSTARLRNVRGWFKKAAPRAEPEGAQKETKVADATPIQTPTKTPIKTPVEVPTKTPTKGRQKKQDVARENLPPNFIPCVPVGNKPPTLSAERRLVLPSNEDDGYATPQPKRRPPVTAATFLNSSLDMIADPTLARSSTIVYRAPSPARSPVIVTPTPVTPHITTGGHTCSVPSSLAVECHTPPISTATPEKHHPDTPEKTDAIGTDEKSAPSTPSSFLHSCTAHLRRRKVQRSPGLGIKIKGKPFAASTSHLPATLSSDTAPVPNSPRPSLPPATKPDMTVGGTCASPISTWAASVPKSDDMKVHLNISTPVCGLNGDAEDKNSSPARFPAVGDEYLVLGDPAPAFFTEFAAQWAQDTPRAVAPAFRIVDKSQLPAGSYCRGWGVYFRDVVVWEAWNGPEKHRKFLVRRPVDPSLAAELASALVLEEDRSSDWQEWSSGQVGFFTRLTRDIPAADIATVEWTRGPWGVRMLAEYLRKGWEEDDDDFESDTDDEALTGRLVPRRIGAPVMRWSAPPGAFGSTVDWLSRLFGRGRTVLPQNETAGVGVGAIPTIRRVFSVKKKRRPAQVATADPEVIPDSVVPPSPKIPGSPVQRTATPTSPSTRSRRLSLLNLGLPPRTYLHIPNIDLDTLGTTNHPDTERSRRSPHSPNRYAFVLELPRPASESPKGSLDVIPEDSPAAPESQTIPSTPTSPAATPPSANAALSPTSWHLAPAQSPVGSIPSTPVSAQSTDSSFSAGLPMSALSTSSSFSAGQPCHSHPTNTRPRSIVSIESPTSTRSTTPTPSSMCSEEAKQSIVATLKSEVLSRSALEPLTEAYDAAERGTTGTTSIASETDLESAQFVQVASCSIMRLRVARVSLRRLGRDSLSESETTQTEARGFELQAPEAEGPDPSLIARNFDSGLAEREMAPAAPIIVTSEFGRPCIPHRSSSLAWRGGTNRDADRETAITTEPSDDVQGGPCREP